jgi:hypothetical protein
MSCGIQFVDWVKFATWAESPPFEAQGKQVSRRKAPGAPELQGR